MSKSRRKKISFYERLEKELLAFPLSKEIVDEMMAAIKPKNRRVG